MSGYLEWLVVGAVVCAVLGAIVGPRNGWSAAGGFAMGLLLGIIGLLIVLLVKGSNPTTADFDRQRQWDEWQRYQQWQGTQTPTWAPPPGPPQWSPQPGPPPPWSPLVSPWREPRPRPRLLVAPDVSDDIRTLPATLRARPVLAVPIILLLVGLVIFVFLPGLPPSLAGMAGYYIQFFFAPPALVTFFLVGVLAPRSGYLIGFLYGIIAGLIWSISILAVGARAVGGPSVDVVLVVLNLLVIGVIYGTAVASLGRLLVRFIDVLQNRQPQYPSG